MGCTIGLEGEGISRIGKFKSKSKIMESFNRGRFKKEYREYLGRWFGG